MAIIKVEKLHFKYEKYDVLKGIDIEINNYKMIGVIGANGCGKTTFLKNVSGYFKPTQGSISVYDKNITLLPSKERAKYIGYVPQEMTHNFNFSCFDIVMMGRIPYLGRFQKESMKDKEIVKDCMYLTDTWDYRDKSINELSGGQRQRVYIARALAQKPKIMLLDEPVSHLDIKYQIDILTLLRDFTIDGILVIVVLHDINLASEFCDEIYMMKDGKIISSGAPNTVITPQNIAETFGINVDIMENPITSTPYIIPSVKRKENLKVV